MKKEDEIKHKNLSPEEVKNNSAIEFMKSGLALEQERQPNRGSKEWVN